MLLLKLEGKQLTEVGNGDRQIPLKKRILVNRKLAAVILGLPLAGTLAVGWQAVSDENARDTQAANSAEQLGRCHDELAGLAGSTVLFSQLTTEAQEVCGYAEELGQFNSPDGARRFHSYNYLTGQEDIKQITDMRVQLPTDAEFNEKKEELSAEAANFDLNQPISRALAGGGLGLVASAMLVAGIPSLRRSIL
jgi:hypothetical protein